MSTSCSPRPETGPSFRGDAKHRTSDVQLHIGESRDSPVRNCAPEVWSFGPSRNDDVMVSRTSFRAAASSRRPFVWVFRTLEVRKKVVMAGLKREARLRAG